MRKPTLFVAFFRSLFTLVAMFVVTGVYAQTVTTVTPLWWAIGGTK